MSTTTSIPHVKPDLSSKPFISTPTSYSFNFSKILDVIQPFVIGGLSGMFATCFIQPIDMIKLTIQIKSQQQKDHKLKINPFKIGAQIYKNEGIKGFYRGIDSALVRQMFYTTTRLGIYKTITDYTKQQNKLKGKKQLSLIQKASCGLLAGFIGSLAGNPPDLALVRMQADFRLPPEERRNYKNVVDAFRRIIKEEGFFALWRGATPTVIRGVVLNLAMLASYDEVKQQLMHRMHEQKQTIHIRIYASLISGVLSSFVSLPFDNAKIKMQKMKQKSDGTLPYKNIFDTMRKTINNQGFTHLWVGFPTFYMRIAPHVCMTLITQDFLTDFVKHFRGKKH